MILCNDEIEFAPWTPDFSSSGQESPSWTRLSSRGLELANSVEWVDWDTNPVQTILCDVCGQTHCGSGNYVHLSQLGDLVIWSSPQVDESDDWAASQYTPSLAVRRFGAVAISAPHWERIREIDAGVPAIGLLAPATRRVLADSWRMSATGPNQVDNLADVIPMLRERLLATDRYDADEAIDLLEPLSDWLGEAPEEPLSGRISGVEPLGASIETLYFDGPHEHDWPAIALLDDSLMLALSRELVFGSEGAA